MISNSLMDDTPDPPTPISANAADSNYEREQDPAGLLQATDASESWVQSPEEEEEASS